MMVTRQLTFVEKEAVEAVLRAVQLLRDAGDEAGALRELQHFVEKMRERLMVPLDSLVDKAHQLSNGFPWIVRSRPERFKLAC